MLTTVYYFLQVIICSAILLGYYWLALRNKRFHQYNRFYLLGVGVLSWLVPLIKIQLTKPEEQAPAQLIRFANIVAGGNTEIEQIVVQEGFVVNWNLVVMSLYTIVCAFFLLWIAIGLYKVFRLLKTYSCKSLGDVYLIMTSNVKGTPFSFFKYIFWNDAIDVNTSTGQQMMQHELTHVREKHSIDKLFMQVIMVFGWFNPFFWLLKRELHLVHEFIADNKAIKDGDASSLAAMLLAAAYPNQQYLLGNPFFFSPIKRRILMLTKTNNPRLSYARRVVVLPMLAIVVMLFAFRKKDAERTNTPLDKVYTVVIDAGHGGKDFGASAPDGTKEKDLALLMLKAIKSANKNDKIKLVFTREGDIYQNPIDKAKFVNEQKPDLFISLHINWTSTNAEKTSGFEINVPKNNDKRGNINESKVFASSIESTLLQSFQTRGIHQKDQNVWILSTTHCPAILLECGFISNPTDLALLKDEKQRSSMAELILQGIENYLHKAEAGNVMLNKFLIENNVQPGDSLMLDGKQIAIAYKGEGIVSIKYEGTNKQQFLIASIKNNWSLTYQQVVDYLDQLETSLSKGKATLQSVEEAKALYVACLQKKEEWELASITATRSKINSAKNKQLNAGLSFAFVHNDLISTLTIEDLLLADLISRRNGLIVSDKSANAKTIQFLNEKIGQRVKDLDGGKPILKSNIPKKMQLQVDANAKYPLNNSYIKQRFGNSKIGSIEIHNDGILVCSKTDGQVKSIAEGKVSFIGNLSDEFMVIVKNNNRYFTYTGMKDIKVQKGQTVAIGTFIGVASNNGSENEMTLMMADEKGNFINPETMLASL